MAQITTEQVGLIARHVEELLKEQCRQRRLDFSLAVVDSMQEAEWLYLVVKPDRQDVRVYDYAEALSTVETRLRRDEHVENVLLVPALSE